MPTTNPFGIDQRGWLTYNGQSYTDRYDPRLYGLTGRAVASGNREQSSGAGTTFNTEAEARAWRDSLPEEYRKFFTDPTEQVTENNVDDSGNSTRVSTWNVGLSEEGQKYLNGRVQLAGGAGVGSGDPGQGFTEVTQDAIANGRLTYDPVFGVLVDPKDIKGPDTDPTGLFRGGPLQNILTGLAIVGGGGLLANSLLGAGGALGGASAGAEAGSLASQAAASAAATGGEIVGGAALPSLATVPEAGTLAAGAGGLGEGGSLMEALGLNGTAVPESSGLMQGLAGEAAATGGEVAGAPWWENFGSRLINSLPAVAQAAQLLKKPDQTNPYAKAGLGGGGTGGGVGVGGGRGGTAGEDFQLKKGPNVLTLAEYLAGARK